MKKIIQLGLLFSMFILGGCGMYQHSGNGSADSPNTRAYNDKFTREFITSSEEVEEGYYLFKSMTEGYTMLFPVEAKVADVSYERNKEAFETYTFGESYEEENLSFYYKIIYRIGELTNNIDVNLKILSEYVGYDGEYEQFEHEGKTYYYATDVYESKYGTNYKYFSYIKSKSDNKALSFTASSTCLNDDLSCDASTLEIEERFKMLMKSVEFTD